MAPQARVLGTWLRFRGRNVRKWLSRPGRNWVRGGFARMDGPIPGAAQSETSDSGRTRSRGGPELPPFPSLKTLGKGTPFRTSPNDPGPQNHQGPPLPLRKTHTGILPVPKNETRQPRLTPPPAARGNQLLKAIGSHKRTPVPAPKKVASPPQLKTAAPRETRP